MIQSPKRLLVTGGSGFIGRQVLPRALSRGYDVFNVDMRPSDVSVAQSVGFAQIDIRNSDELSGLFQQLRPTHVLHLASDTDVSLSKPEDFTTVTEGSRAVFAAAEAQDTVERFVHVSTQYVLEPGIRPEHDRHYKPYTVYGEAKAQIEKEIWDRPLTNWTIVRPTIVWGPKHPTFGDELWKYISKRVYLHPASRTPIIRNYGYVENVADQMVAIVDTPAAQLDRKVYYLGDMNLDYATWADAFALALTGRKSRKIPKSALFGLGLLGEGAKRVGLRFPYNLGRYHRMTTASELDLSPTFSVTGAPIIPFPTGVERTAQWLREYWAGS